MNKWGQERVGGEKKGAVPNEVFVNSWTVTFFRNKELLGLCSTKMMINGKVRSQMIPKPRKRSRMLLVAAKVKLPNAIPWGGCVVATKKKLQKQRR